MEDPSPEEPKEYSAGIMFTADKRWKLFAQVAITALFVGGTYRLLEYLF